MSASSFRSHLMQQFVAAARAQTQHHQPSSKSRPISIARQTVTKTVAKTRAKPAPPPPPPASPLSSQHFHTVNKAEAETTASKDRDRDRDGQDNIHSIVNAINRNCKISMQDHSNHHNTSSPLRGRSISHPFSTATATATSRKEEDLDGTKFQTMLKSRRTISNFLPLNIITDGEEEEHQLQHLNCIEKVNNAILRAVECAVTAPNHKKTEPVTYHNITPYTKTWMLLLRIVYDVTAYKNFILGNKTPEEADSIAFHKREKWQDTILGYVVVTVGGQPNQLPPIDNNDDDDDDVDKEHQDDNDDNEFDVRMAEILPVRPPETERQMEDYAHACAAVQNILLSLHSEGLGAKWATGPIIRTRAMRKVLELKNDDLIVGIVMVGKAKKVPKEWRRRREFAGDVFRDCD